jgi:hypothetical protein
VVQGVKENLVRRRDKSHLFGRKRLID